MPAWSPDGRSIAFIREFGDHDELYVIDTLGATPRELARELHGFLAFPDWAPDGRWILFGAGATPQHL
jgi:Tol biopolymer transport system component